MNHNETLNEIKKAIQAPSAWRNSMWCSENYYDSYYMIGKCFTEEELEKMNDTELDNIFKLANFASEVFY